MQYQVPWDVSTQSLTHMCISSCLSSSRRQIRRVAFDACDQLPSNLTTLLNECQPREGLWSEDSTSWTLIVRQGTSFGVAMVVIYHDV